MASKYQKKRETKVISKHTILVNFNTLLSVAGKTDTRVINKEWHYWLFTLESKNLSSHRNLYTNVHNSFICNSKKLETIPMSFNR